MSFISVLMEYITSMFSNVHLACFCSWSVSYLIGNFLVFNILQLKHKYLVFTPGLGLIFIFSMKMSSGVSCVLIF